MVLIRLGHPAEAAAETVDRYTGDALNVQSAYDDIVEQYRRELREERNRLLRVASAGAAARDRERIPSNEGNAATGVSRDAR